MNTICLPWSNTWTLAFLYLACRLPLNSGRATRQRFAELPVDLDYREYDIGHTISDESLAGINTWLGARWEDLDSQC